MAQPRYSRREFLNGLVGAAVVARGFAAAPAGKIRFGYASITWDGKDLQAIDEIAALGFPGIQLRSNILQQFGSNPRGLKDLLAERKLELAAFSSGAVRLDPALDGQMIEEHVGHARFLHDAGGRVLQITDERSAGRPATPDDCARLGDLLTRIGKQTAELGVAVAYHPHMGTVGEKPEDSDRVLAAADPRYVKLLLDVAHYQQGGGDPVAAIRTHRDRLLLLHLKDLEAVAPKAAGGKPGYRFVELGRGRVDLKGVLGALSSVGFEGWCIVELDAVTDVSRTPLESARISKSYLEAAGYRIH